MCGSSRQAKQDLNIKKLGTYEGKRNNDEGNNEVKQSHKRMGETIKGIKRSRRGQKETEA